LLLTPQYAAALRALGAACDPIDWEYSGINAGHDLLFGGLSLFQQAGAFFGMIHRPLMSWHIE